MKRCVTGKSALLPYLLFSCGLSARVKWVRPGTSMKPLLIHAGYSIFISLRFRPPLRDGHHVSVLCPKFCSTYKATLPSLPETLKSFPSTAPRILPSFEPCREVDPGRLSLFYHSRQKKIGIPPLLEELELYH